MKRPKTKEMKDGAKCLLPDGRTDWPLMGRRGRWHGCGGWASITALGSWRSCILIDDIVFGKHETETLSENMRECSLKFGENRDWWEYSAGKNTRVGSHSLLWGIFPTQGSSPSLLHCRQILFHLSHQGNSIIMHSRLKRLFITVNIILKFPNTFL